MIKVIFICDRCKHEQDSNKQMWEIGVRFRHHENYQDKMELGHSTNNTQLWCRKCIEELGYIEAPKNDPPKPEVFESFEDKIREIVRSEIEANR